MQRRKTKQLLINPKFQLSVIAYTLLVSALVTGIMYGAHHFLASTFVERGKTLGLPEDHVYFRFLTEQQDLMSQVFFATIAFAFVINVIGGLVLSHRVAGPIARIKTHLDDLSKGKELREFKFRTRDFFPELAESFNALIRSQKK